MGQGTGQRTGLLTGKVALITGVARGQGRSHAVRLAEEGADIIGIDNCETLPTTPYAGSTVEDLAETVRLVEATGRRIIAARADVRSLDELVTAVDAGVARLGRLDIVSANAGILSMAATLDMTEHQWTELIDVNLSGVWRTCRAALPHMVAGGRGGTIVITSSSTGLKARPNIAHYVASKHALVGLARSLAIEFAPHNIRVNTVHPTSVDTPMILNEATYRMFRPELDDPTSDDMSERAVGMNALRVPWVKVEDVSNALVYLASEQGRYLTGVALPIDAGNTIL